ncbi:helix-turn-helix domain-containing protein [Domibacillus tundrae]|uniref:helix-turn-helix domain-containing protein n=1 Tax=Domibacillus tundrae TaxID=1587527 RepID=UPI000617B482|nr:helix-turn-helix transcriptional regulator [Domibacillus tundrae]
MTYGDRLKSLRTARNLSQQEVADRLSINRSTYARYELSKTQPDFETLEQLAAFYDVTTDYIIKGNTNDNSSLAKDKKEMMEFFNNPRLNVFFKEMADSPEEQLEELQEFWEIIKKRGLHKK